jgi:hypothetical protein
MLQFKDNEAIARAAWDRLFLKLKEDTAESGDILTIIPPLPEEHPPVRIIRIKKYERQPELKPRRGWLYREMKQDRRLSR